jgi:hypothetical protein
MSRDGVGLSAGFRFLVLRQFTHFMLLAGTAEDQQPGSKRETGPAKKKSHNAPAR